MTRRRKKRAEAAVLGIVVLPVGSSGYATTPAPVPSPLPSKVSLATIEMSKPVAAGLSGGVWITGLPEASKEIERSGGLVMAPVGMSKR